MRASCLPIAFGVAVLGPDLVGDVAAAGLQVLVPAAFAQDPSPMPPKGVGFPDPLSGTLNMLNCPENKRLSPSSAGCSTRPRS